MINQSYPLVVCCMMSTMPRLRFSRPMSKRQPICKEPHCLGNEDHWYILMCDIQETDKTVFEQRSQDFCQTSQSRSVFFLHDRKLSMCDEDPTDVNRIRLRSSTGKQPHGYLQNERKSVAPLSFFKRRPSPMLSVLSAEHALQFLSYRTDFTRPFRILNIFAD